VGVLVFRGAEGRAFVSEAWGFLLSPRHERGDGEEINKIKHHPNSLCLTRVHDRDDRLGRPDRRHHRRHHALLQLGPLLPHDPGRVEKHHLVVWAAGQADDPVPRGLRPGADGAELLAHERVDERRLARVWPADHRHVARPMPGRVVAELVVGQRGLVERRRLVEDDGARALRLPLLARLLLACLLLLLLLLLACLLLLLLLLRLLLA
jgi:hypothetical protein